MDRGGLKPRLPGDERPEAQRHAANDVLLPVRDQPLALNGLASSP
jgi:hypothetical protein